MGVSVAVAIGVGVMVLVGSTKDVLVGSGVEDGLAVASAGTSVGSRTLFPGLTTSGKDRCVGVGEGRISSSGTFGGGKGLKKTCGLVKTTKNRISAIITPSIVNPVRRFQNVSFIEYPSCKVK